MTGKHNRDLKGKVLSCVLLSARGQGEPSAN